MRLVLKRTQDSIAISRIIKLLAARILCSLIANTINLTDQSWYCLLPCVKLQCRKSLQGLGKEFGLHPVPLLLKKKWYHLHQEEWRSCEGHLWCMHSSLKLSMYGRWMDVVPGADSVLGMGCSKLPFLPWYKTLQVCHKDKYDSQVFYSDKRNSWSSSRDKINATSILT